MNGHAGEITRGERFPFGANWANFLAAVDKPMVDNAILSLQSMLGKTSLCGVRFLDAGCGSGLFSLAARQMGATVYSFDYDPESVACAETLKASFHLDDDLWEISEGSVLDKDFLARLGDFDVVYSWGVLHHTGSMWAGLSNLSEHVVPNGQLFVALYNDAGASSRYWRRLKAAYCRFKWLRPILTAYGIARLRSGWILRAIFSMHPLDYLESYGNNRRGMSAWNDLIDWIGGYPYEYAKPGSVLDYMRTLNMGFELSKLVTVGGELGCNEFVFSRYASAQTNDHTAPSPNANGDHN